MNKQDLKQLIQEELKSILNEGRVEWKDDFPKIYPKGTKITYDSKPATILSNFMDRGAPFAGYKIQFEDGTTKEISSASKDIDLAINTLNEEYQDKFKFYGRLVTNINNRPQQEILSDIRAIAGDTIVSTRELKDYGNQSFSNFNTILKLKIDGYPFIKTGGFSRETIDIIVKRIQEVPDVISFKYSPKSIEAI